MTNRRDAKVQSVFSGVDWISGTLGREELDNQTWMYDCLHALSDVQSLGNTYKRRSLLGFDGWESGGCFVGSNDTMHYAQFAGKYANDAYHMLDHPKVHISRIDLQITVQYDIELIKEGRYQYAHAIHYNKSLPEHRRRKIHLYAGSDGADTVYLGSPSSDLRGRVYNKAKQSGDASYERSWRYEVVYRNTYASSLFRGVLNADNQASQFILSQVTSWYDERGVSVLGLGNIGSIFVETPKHPKSDVARKLRWIRTQVVPTIRKLAELGYAEELMETIAEAIAAARNSQQ
jgi:DNA relaxase NicK